MVSKGKRKHVLYYGTRFKSGYTTEGVIIDNKKYSCYTRLPFTLFSHNVRLLRGSSVFILCSSAFGLHSGPTNNSMWRGPVALLAQRGRPPTRLFGGPLSATSCSYSCSSVAPLSLARHGRPLAHAATTLNSMEGI